MPGLTYNYVSIKASATNYVYSVTYRQALGVCLPSPHPVVDIFKYLRIIFKYNGTFNLQKKSLNQQATCSKAMLVMLSKCNSLDLPIDVQLDHFDKMVHVLPILTHGCEVWGNGNNSLIEMYI